MSVRDRAKLLPLLMRWFHHPAALFARAASAEARYRQALEAVNGGAEAEELVSAEKELSQVFADAAAGVAVNFKHARTTWESHTYCLAPGWEVGLRNLFTSCLSSSRSISSAEVKQVETTVSRFLGDCVQPHIDAHRHSPAMFVLAMSLNAYKQRHTSTFGVVDESALMAMHVLLRNMRFEDGCDPVRWVVASRVALFMSDDVEERLKMLDEFERAVKDL